MNGKIVDASLNPWDGDNPVFYIQIGPYQQFTTFHKSMKVFESTKEVAENLPDCPRPLYSWWILFDDDQETMICQQLSCSFSRCHGTQLKYYAHNSNSYVQIGMTEEQAVQLKDAIKRDCQTMFRFHHRESIPSQYIFQPRNQGIKYIM